jgi:hypothetical protein
MAAVDRTSLFPKQSLKRFLSEKSHINTVLLKYCTNEQDYKKQD